MYVCVYVWWDYNNPHTTKTSDLLDQKKKKKKTKDTWQFSDILRRAKQNPSR